MVNAMGSGGQPAGQCALWDNGGLVQNGEPFYTLQGMSG